MDDEGPGERNGSEAMVEAIAAKRPLMYVRQRWLTEINYFSFKSNLLGISFGTRTSKSDLLQKVTEMVVECSCLVKKIVGKDWRRRKTTLPR